MLGHPLAGQSALARLATLLASACAARRSCAAWCARLGMRPSRSRGSGTIPLSTLSVRPNRGWSATARRPARSDWLARGGCAGNFRAPRARCSRPLGVEVVRTWRACCIFRPRAPVAPARTRRTSAAAVGCGSPPRHGGGGPTRDAHSHMPRRCNFFSLPQEEAERHARRPAKWGHPGRRAPPRINLTRVRMAYPSQRAFSVAAPSCALRIRSSSLVQRQPCRRPVSGERREPPDRGHSGPARRSTAARTRNRAPNDRVTEAIEPGLNPLQVGSVVWAAGWTLRSGHAES